MPKIILLPIIFIFLYLIPFECMFVCISVFAFKQKFKFQTWVDFHMQNDQSVFPMHFYYVFPKCGFWDVTDLPLLQRISSPRFSGLDKELGEFSFKVVFSFLCSFVFGVFAPLES